MTKWINGIIIEKTEWKKGLYSISVKAKINNYKAGQFAMLSLELNKKRVSKAYSFVNSPSNNDIHEFYFIEVPDGKLTPFLSELEVGDQINIAQDAYGFFTIDEVPNSDNLWMLSTGTAIGVFLSMLQTKEPWEKFNNIVLVHGVRKKEDLSYSHLINELIHIHGDKFKYLPIVSRENSKGCLSGRITDNISNKLMENISGIALNSDLSQVMISGNPDMVKEVQSILFNKGFKKNLRKEKGNVTIERYW